MTAPRGLLRSRLVPRALSAENQSLYSAIETEPDESEQDVKGLTVDPRRGKVCPTRLEGAPYAIGTVGRSDTHATAASLARIIVTHSSVLSRLCQRPGRSRHPHGRRALATLPCRAMELGLLG